MVAGLLVLGRVLLPTGVAYVVERQAASALRAQVEIGDVDLALLRGAVALEDVRVREADDPPDAEPVIAWRRVATNLAWWPLVRREIRLQSLEIDAPRVAVDRLASGRLNLAALLPQPPPPAPDAGGSEGHPAGTGPREPAPGAEGPSADGAGWGVAIDQFALRDGGLRFRDLMVAGAEPVEIVLPDVQLTEFGLLPGAYDRPGRLRVRLGVDRGRLDVDAAVRMRADGPVLDARLRAVRLPLRRTRVYVPNVGLTELHGEAGTALQLRYAPDTGPAVGGTLLVRDLTVEAEGLAEPALAWRQLVVRVDRVALERREAVVREVRLDGPSLLVLPGRPDPLPVVAIARSRKAAAGGLAADEAAGDDGDAASGGAGSGPAGTPAPPADAPPAAPPPDAPPGAPAPVPPDEPPWRWEVQLVRLDDLRVAALREDRRVDLSGSVEVRDLAGPEAAMAAVKAALAVRDATLGIEGTASLAPVGFTGRLEIAGLALPELVAISGAVPAEPLTGATLSLGLDLKAAPATEGIRVTGDVTLDGIAAAWPTPADMTVGASRLALGPAEVAIPPSGAVAPVRVSGTLTVDGLAVARPGATPVTLAVRHLDVKASELTLPGAGTPDPLRVRAEVALDALSVAGPRPEESAVSARRIEVASADVALPGAAAPGPTRATIGALRIDAPTVVVTRTAGGILLPGTAPAAADAGPAATAQGAPAAPDAAPPPAPPGESPPSPEIALATFRITGGSLTVVDRTVKPFYTGRLQPFSVDVENFRLPGPVIGRLRLDAVSKAGGRLQVTGAVGARDARLDLDIRELALPPFNPYATAASSYSIPRGRLSLQTDATRRGDRYTSTSKLVLHDLDVGGAQGDALFQQQFGIPLTVALALLRDLDGDIVLDVPLERDPEGTRVGLGSIVAGALRQALLGALASPLKMASSLFGGGAGAGTTPARIGFLPGRDVLAPEADEQLDGVGQLLASRPGLALRLGAAPAPADVRWLAERDVAAELATPRGVLTAIGDIRERGTRQRVAAALAARASGQEGALEPEDAEALDRWVAERPAIAPERLTALAEARVARVRAVLSQRHGIPEARVVPGDPPPEPPTEPSLLVSLGAAAG